MDCGPRQDKVFDCPINAAANYLRDLNVMGGDIERILNTLRLHTLQ